MTTYTTNYNLPKPATSESPNGPVQISALADAVDAAIATGVARVIPHTFAVGGSIAVPVGALDYIPPMFVPVPAGRTVSLVSCRYRINGGTSATIKLRINGVDALGFAGMVATTTAATTDPADITLSNNDMLAVVVTSVSGAPTNLSVTMFLEYR